MIIALKRPRCRISKGSPGPEGKNWESIDPLPDMVCESADGFTAPETSIRAMAGREHFHVRFDCRINDISLFHPKAPGQPLREGDYAKLIIHPHNDPSDFIEFAVDYRGVLEMIRHRRMPGEHSLGAIPDLWQSQTQEKTPYDLRVYHGLTESQWWAELDIPWRALGDFTLGGLTSPPVVMGFGYGRAFQTGLAFPQQAESVWPTSERSGSLPATLEPGEALIGDEAFAPDYINLDEPRFGLNSGRMFFNPDEARRAKFIQATTDFGDGGIFGEFEQKIKRGARSVGFKYFLDRNCSSHTAVFSPPSLLIALTDNEDRPYYNAILPMDRHLGVCIDEPYGEPDSQDKSNQDQRNKMLRKAVAAIPRLERRTTVQNAPSDFCLMLEDGTLAVNLMSDDAWEKLAAIVESSTGLTEERLVAAMALIGQKSVTNLIISPMFFNPDGKHFYHSCLHEMMGPLSVIRYGGGTSLARAASLARLLQHVTDPATGETFRTRVISLTEDGGPRQVERGFLEGNLGAFAQYPGRIGCVAVDYKKSQTLLDPTSFVFFPAGHGKLLTVEKMLEDEVYLNTGAGALAPVYKKLDIEEMRRQPVDRLLSRGVFPELCPDEDGIERPFNLGERQINRTIHAPMVQESEAIDDFRDIFGRKGRRDGTVTVSQDSDSLFVSVKVSGVRPGSLDEKDQAMERVHLAIDAEHGHQKFHHFSVSLAGERRGWFEISTHIQKLFKHLATNHYAEIRKLDGESWSADIISKKNGYEVEFFIGMDALDIALGNQSPVLGINVWLEGRRPHYEQVFLCPPRWHLPADPFNFADLYLDGGDVKIEEIDFGAPTWGMNTARVTFVNSSETNRLAGIHATNRLNTIRSAARGYDALAFIPAGGKDTVEVDYLVEPSVKMSNQTIGFQATHRGEVIYTGEWQVSYMGPISVYERFGVERRNSPNRTSVRDKNIAPKIDEICLRLPRFDRLTTRDGAASDFVLRAEDGSAEFNLMAEGVLDRIGEYIHGLFDNDLDRVLGMFWLACQPSVLRHMSFGHRIMNGAGPLTIIRGNFAGGGGNCGFHARAFTGMMQHLRIGGKPMSANVIGVWGHAIAAIGWRGSKALVDPDVGHLIFTRDGDLATISEFLAYPSLPSTAGTSEIARLFTANEESVLARKDIAGDRRKGVWPPGGPTK